MLSRNIFNDKNCPIIALLTESNLSDEKGMVNILVCEKTPDELQLETLFSVIMYRMSE